MAMNANTLKADLKGDLIAIFKLCNEGEGLTMEEYADKIAASFSSRVVQHIQKYAEVATEVSGSSVVTGMAATVPVTGTGVVKGTGKGTVS